MGYLVLLHVKNVPEFSAHRLLHLERSSCSYFFEFSYGVGWFCGRVLGVAVRCCAFIQKGDSVLFPFQEVSRIVILNQITWEITTAIIFFWSFNSGAGQFFFWEDLTIAFKSQFCYSS